MTRVEIVAFISQARRRRPPFVGSSARRGAADRGERRQAADAIRHRCIAVTNRVWGGRGPAPLFQGARDARKGRIEVGSETLHNGDYCYRNARRD